MLWVKMHQTKLVDKGRSHHKVVVTKAAVCPQLFKESECWFDRVLNPRPPALLNKLYVNSVDQSVWSISVN